MSGLCFRMLAGLAVVMTVTGCVTTQLQADGSTKVHLSLGGFGYATHGEMNFGRTVSLRLCRHAAGHGHHNGQAGQHPKADSPHQSAPYDLKLSRL